MGNGEQPQVGLSLVGVAVIGAAVMAACGASQDEGPPAAAEGSVRSVAATIASCVEDPRAAMSGVSVSQSDDDPSAMEVTLAGGAVFSVAEGSSQPEPVNAQAESLLAGCP